MEAPLAGGGLGDPSVPGPRNCAAGGRSLGGAAPGGLRSPETPGSETGWGQSRADDQPARWCRPWRSSVCTTCGCSASPSWVFRWSLKPGVWGSQGLRGCGAGIPGSGGVCAAPAASPDTQRAHESSGPAHHCPSARKTPSPEAQPQAGPQHCLLSEAECREPAGGVQAAGRWVPTQLSRGPIPCPYPRAHLTFR